VFLVRVDDSRVQAGFRDVAAAARGLTKVFQQLRAPMRRDQADHARKEEGPDGPWPARKSEQRALKTYAKVRRKRGGATTAKVYRYHGLLGVVPNVVQVRAIGRTVFARWPIKWASAHADGDVVGHGVKLPARSFAWVSEQLGDLANKMIGDHIKAAWDDGHTR